MGSSITRIDDVYESYERFCKKLGEPPKDYEHLQLHTQELINKHNIAYSLWWYHLSLKT